MMFMFGAAATALDLVIAALVKPGGRLPRNEAIVLVSI